MSFQDEAGLGGFSRSRLERVTRSLEGYLEREEILCAVTRVFRHGVLAHQVTLGWQDRENLVPMQPDSIFRIMSMTKPVIAAAALTLVEEGTLRLDDPVDPWLPELADRQILLDPDGPLDGEVYPSLTPITLRDILTNRLGIGFHLGRVPYCAMTLDYNPGPLSYAQRNQGHPRKTLDLPPDEWMAEIGKLPWRYSPGEYWLYNTASDILGVLLARATGMDLAKFLQQRLFEPLGMRDTGFVVPAEKLDRFTVGYALDSTGQKIIAIDHPANSFYARPPIFPSGAAGLVSTADDYLKFGRMLLGKGKVDNTRILSRKAVELMTTDQLNSEQRAAAIGGPGFGSNQGYGFGVATINEQTQLGPGAGAYTWGGAYGTHWVADPGEDLVIVLLYQMMSGPQHISEDFNTLVYQAIDD